MSEALKHPVLGVLTRRWATEWVGRVWFTPKHQIEVVFNQSSFDEDESLNLAEDLDSAAGYFGTLRRKEWEIRLSAARGLIDRVAHLLGPLPLANDLALALRLVAVYLRGDSSGRLIYRGPPLLARYAIHVRVKAEGKIDGVDLITVGA